MYSIQSILLHILLLKISLLVTFHFASLLKNMDLFLQLLVQQSNGEAERAVTIVKSLLEKTTDYI